MGKVVIADLIGDRAILEAMRTNEAATNTAYERAIDRERLSTTVLLETQKTA